MNAKIEYNFRFWRRLYWSLSWNIFKNKIFLVNAGKKKTKSASFKNI
jgi:hypothetical protein